MQNITDQLNTVLKLFNRGEKLKAFEKIITKTPKSKNGQGYTEKDLKAFENIVSSKGKKTETELKTEVKNVQGKIYDTPKF